MELDVIYRIPKDLIWQYINKYVYKNSVNLVLFRTCLDNYTNQKTINKAVSRLSTNGFFCLQVFPENVSYIIKCIENNNLQHQVVYFCTNSNDISMFLLCGQNIKNTQNQIIFVENFSDLEDKLIFLCNTGDIILLVGDFFIPLAHKCKNFGRHIIGFGNEDCFVSIRKNYSIREISL